MLDIQEFVEFYPQFADKFSDNRLNYLYDESTDLSEFIWTWYKTDADKLKKIQYLALAHLLTLELNPTSGVITSVGQGSVNASFDYYDKSPTGAWFKLTDYGKRALFYRQQKGTLTYVR